MGGSDLIKSSLSRWIGERHLQPEAMAILRAQFEGRPERYLIIDDFLIPARLEKIRDVLMQDGIVEPAYMLRDQGWTTREQFVGAPDAGRLIYETAYTGPRGGREMAPSIVEEILFRKEMRDRPFRTWLSDITGQPITRTGEINLKRLHIEHMLRWHSDRVPARTLCMVLYLQKGWEPSFGGRLLMERRDGGDAIAINPLWNRLVLFDPQSDGLHGVEALSDAAAGWARLNYSTWFYQDNR